MLGCVRGLTSINGLMKIKPSTSFKSTNHDNRLIFNFIFDFARIAKILNFLFN